MTFILAHGGLQGKSSSPSRSLFPLFLSSHFDPNSWYPSLFFSFLFFSFLFFFLKKKTPSLLSEPENTFGSIPPPRREHLSVIRYRYPQQSFHLRLLKLLFV